MAQKLTVENIGRTQVTVICGLLQIQVPAGGAARVAAGGWTQQGQGRGGGRARLKPGTPEYKAEVARLDRELDEYMEVVRRKIGGSPIVGLE